MIICLAILIIGLFSVVGTGMGMFRGKFHYCSDSTLVFPQGKLDCSGVVTGAGGFLAPRAWLVPEYNFESFVRSFAMLLCANTLKFVHVMHVSMDITERDKVPMINHSFGCALFWVVYVVIGAFFVMNLFIAFIMDGFLNFRKQEKKATHSGSRAQFVSFFNDIRRHSPHRQPPTPSNPLSTFLREKVLPSPAFGIFSLSCAILNVGFIASYHADQEPWADRLMNRQNAVFTSLLALEILVQCAGFGTHKFLQDRWNYINLIVLLGSVLSLTDATNALTPKPQTFGQMCRLLRVLMLVKAIPAGRSLVSSIVQSMSQFLDVSFLLFCVFSLYAVIFLFLLGNTKEGVRLGSPLAKFPADPPNFHSYAESMYTLFRMIQGDEWHLLMYDATVQPPFCTLEPPDGLQTDCGVLFGSGLFLFTSFELLAQYMLLSVFIGSILNAFCQYQDGSVDFHINDRQSKSVKIGRTAPKAGKEDMGAFTCWRRFAGVGRDAFLRPNQIKMFIKYIPQPLGYPRDSFGEPIISTRDRAITKLIAAELHLVAMFRAQDKAKLGPWQRWALDHLRALNLLPAVPKDSTKATFEETFATIFY